MDPPEGMGSRSSVDVYEVGAEERIAAIWSSASICRSWSSGTRGSRSLVYARGRRRARVRVRRGLGERPLPVPDPVARRADGAGRGGRALRLHGARDDGLAGLAARAGSARKDARRAGRPLRRARRGRGRPRLVPARLRRGRRALRRPLAALRRGHRAAAGSAAARLAARTGPAARRRHPDLARELGLGRRATARRAARRRLVCVGLQHDAGGLRRREGVARRGASSSRPGRRAASPTRW